MTLLVTCSVTLLFSVYGGLRAILWTDLFQFFLAMGGAVAASVYVLGLPEVGGIQGLMTHPNVMGKLSVWPDFSNPEVWVPVMLVPLAVQWWASYYPGAEPGEEGTSPNGCSAPEARTTPWAPPAFQCRPLRLRPWPWILVALASLIVFPDLEAIATAFPELAADKVGHDVAYPAMLSLLPAGLLGWVAASLLAAFISTMSTQVNLGASYLVHDGWARFIRPMPRRPKGHRWPLGQPALLARWCASEPHPHFCLAGVQPLAFVGGRNGRPVHPALVLVAHLGQHRNCRHGHVIACGRLFHLGPRSVGTGLWLVTPGQLGEAGGRKFADHCRMGGGRFGHEARIPRGLANLCRQSPTRRSRLEAISSKPRRTGATTQWNVPRALLQAFLGCASPSMPPCSGWAPGCFAKQQRPDGHRASLLLCGGSVWGILRLQSKP